MTVFKEVSKHVGGQVAARRREVGLSCEALARRLQVAPARLADWEAGRLGILPGELVDLAAALGCRTSRFFDGFAIPISRSSRPMLRIVAGTDYERP